MKDRIIKILNEVRPEFNFGTEINFISQGMLDSFDLVTLVTELDESFGISIDGTDILPQNFESVEAIEALLKKNGAQ
ncbi:acyl carrier protein [uncultured Chryseobacterium sp.]|uniref:acyl carrier protein n=1 Tax=uncultured Chryseobacterium sp. TaxID=259322 RepID=UPI0025DF0A6B|nr:acyl carrier protein [uncultured Chryseobacterium sp.]